MAMVVQHNMTAMNANRMLGVTVGQQAKSTEKLSSGFKINRAADDAAGLAISEKMRKQMRGLDRASTNAQDGISAVQTAEGALTEVHSMLQRMNELATQAANGTNSEDDRKSIQNEIDQLTTEIDRVAETTKFNETYLLKGEKNTTTKTLAAYDAGIKGTFVDGGNAGASLTVDLSVGNKISIAGQNYNIIEGGDAAEAKDSLEKVQNDVKKATDTVTIDGTQYNYAAGKFDAGTGSTYTAAELADKIKDGASVKIGAESKVTVRDYNNSSNITADMAANKIQQALTQANNIGATKKAASVAIQEPDTSETKNIQTIKDAGAKITANGAMVAYNAITKELTEIADKADITELVNNSDVTLYKSATSVTLGANDKAQSGLLLVHKDTTVSGVEKVYAKGDTVATVADQITVTSGTAAPDTGNKYALYEEINLVNDAKFENASHEAYAKLADKNGAKFNVNFEKLDIDANAANAEKIAEGQNALNDAFGKISYTVPTANGTGVFSHDFDADSKLDIDENGVVSYDGIKIATIEQIDTASTTVGTAKLALDGDAIDAEYVSKATDSEYTFNITKGTTEVAEDLTLNLHVGSDADMTNKISVDISSMSASGLGISGINVADDSGIAATYAVDAIENAIKTVSAQRSTLGAAQNRLEHTIANLDNVVENTTSAESQIRDTDMATEMVNYSKNNILAQAGQSMLAQANQSNQGILSLLG